MFAQCLWRKLLRLWLWMWKDLNKNEFIKYIPVRFHLVVMSEILGFILHKYILFTSARLEFYICHMEHLGANKHHTIFFELNKNAFGLHSVLRFEFGKFCSVTIVKFFLDLPISRVSCANISFNSSIEKPIIHSRSFYATSLECIQGNTNKNTKWKKKYSNCVFTRPSFKILVFFQEF